MSNYSVDLVPVFIDRVIVLDKGIVVQMARLKRYFPIR